MLSKMTFSITNLSKKKGLLCDTQHNNDTTLCSECHYGERSVLFNIMLMSFCRVFYAECCGAFLLFGVIR
jgi:hypothetical protein